MKVCIYCGGENKRPRSTLCSPSCQAMNWHKQHPERVKKSRLKRYRRISKEFNEFKEKIGCQVCGYNKCGASLDFHHTSNWNFNVNADEWASKNPRIRDKVQEINNCVLLCKNCHTELHYKERNR